MAKGSDARPHSAETDGADQPVRHATRTGRPGVWAVSPSDFAFLWDECPRCFHNKVVVKKSRPRMPFPQVFSRIDRAMKEFCLGERAEELAEGAPPGVIGEVDRWVKSAPIAAPGCSTPLIIRGRVDALVACDDGTTAVIDFKTAEPKEAHIATYGRQLHAYATALEQPASGRPTHVSALGLLCFHPGEFEAHDTSAVLLGDLAWIEVPRDDAGFYAFLIEVGSVLDQPEPPPPSEGCPWCSWTPADFAVA